MPDKPEENRMEKDCDPCSSHNTEFVLWTITGRCNFRCRFCCVNTPDAAMDEITHEEAIRIIDRMAKCGVRSLKISGGEPFVREDFWSLVDYTLEKGMKIEKIYTNGWLLTDSVLDQFEQRGMKPEFCVGFDGVEKHDWMRGIKGAEQAARNALIRCYLRGFPTSVEMNIHRGNTDVLRETVDTLADFGVRKIICHEVRNNDMWKRYAVGNEMSTKEYVEAVLRYIPEYYADGMRVDVRFDGVVELYKGGKYKVIDGTDNGNASWYIESDGRIMQRIRNLDEYGCLMWKEGYLEKVRETCVEAIKQFKAHSA